MKHSRRCELSKAGPVQEGAIDEAYGPPTLTLTMTGLGWAGPDSLPRAPQANVSINA